MDMNHQQRAEWIEQCRRNIDAQDAAYRKATADHEAEVRRIVLESQAEIIRIICQASLALSLPPEKEQVITVAM